jgi:hypothetical protein
VVGGPISRTSDPVPAADGPKAQVTMPDSDKPSVVMRYVVDETATPPGTPVPVKFRVLAGGRDIRNAKMTVTPKDDRPTFSAFEPG